MQALAFGCRGLLTLSLVLVAACDSGSSSPPPAQPTPVATPPAPEPPPAPAAPAPAPTPEPGPQPPPTPPPPAPPPPAPEPPPSPPPPEPPPPGDTLPPLASVVINVADSDPVGDPYWPDGNTSTGGFGDQVQGLRCGDMVETYHVHTHLSFFLDGKQLALPSSIGNVSPRPGTSCFYPLHTHDLSGKVHVEADAPALFTLGQLFAIWGQPLEPTNLAGLTGLPVVIYIVDRNVNTYTASRYEGDFHAIELKSQRGIVVQIGTRIAEIPRYTWYAP
jgi:hypothetical protein